MLRSVSLSVLQAGKSFTGHDCQRLVQRLLPSLCLCERSLHSSTYKFSAYRGRPEKGQQHARARGAASPKDELSKKIREAAVNAAKSVSGDWTKIAEELLARLQVQKSPEANGKLPELEQDAAQPDKHLLETMEIGRSFSTTKTRNDFLQPLRKKRDMGQKPLESYELYQMPRLDIFDAKKLQEEAKDQPEPYETDDLWVKMDAEHVRKVLGALPRNAFEEMAQWTKEGKLWKFPIDNEADMDEERKYKFHDHIFLERHLTDFPSSGPIRKFMELAVLGMSNNPWLTVPEKIEHIRWFADYFRQKQDILEASIGEEGRMKPADGQIE